MSNINKNFNLHGFRDHSTGLWMVDIDPVQDQTSALSGSPSDFPSGDNLSSSLAPAPHLINNAYDLSK